MRASWHVTSRPDTLPVPKVRSKDRAVRLRAMLVSITLLIAACGRGAPSPAPPGSHVPTNTPVASAIPNPSAQPVIDPPTESPDAAGLVGEWRRETRCEEIVAALAEAGLDAWVLEYAAAFVPGASGGDDLADPTRPCDGAAPLHHSHFFTADGRFGSRDQDGRQVDDGTYRIVDERTFVVSKEFPDVTFHFEVAGDSITFEPVVPSCSPDCFEAVWSVTVAYPRLPWKRVG